MKTSPAGNIPAGGPTPVLEGFGVRLLPLALAHLPALEHTHDESTWKYMSETGRTPALLREFVERALEATETGATQVWATTILRDGRQAEVIGTTRIADLDLRHRRGEIGWTWIAPPYCGSGVNVRVKLLQLRHAFETLRLRRIALKTHHANLRSQRAMLKLGARHEGTFRNHMIMPDGTSRDTVWYSILDSDWPAVQAHLLQRIASEPLPKR